MLKRFIISFILVLPFWITTSPAAESEINQALAKSSKQQPVELGWSNLIPEGFDAQSLINKFADDLIRLEELPDGSEEGLEILKRIQAAVDAIPSNDKLDNKWIKLPGFIAPLDIKDGKVTRFLLVPYFGACIHVPPPPVNQTVLVDLLPDQGITIEEVDYPFMVTGKMTLDRTTTDIGKAGYHITQATVKIHHDDRWLEVEE